MKAFATLPLSLALAAMVSSQAFAQFPGVPGVPGMNNSSSPPADIDGFLSSASTAEHLVGQSALHIDLALTSGEQAQKLRDEQAAAAAIQDPKEKAAAVSKLDADAAATANALDYDAASKSLAAEKDANKSKEVGAAIYNLALGLLKDKDALDQGQAVVRAVTSNPMNAMRMGSKLGQAKNAVSSLTTQVGYTPKILGGLQKLSSVAKIDHLPTSSAEKPKLDETGL